jgi:aminoacrylate hydrolase
VSLISESAEKTTIGGLAVTVYGPAEAEPVLMSAGLGGSGSYWKPQLAALAAGYRVILYDHRGTGASERSIPSPYCSRNLAADMASILDGLALPAAHVVGHAAGGIAGLELALGHPGRVKSLTVVNGWAVADPHFKRCFEIRLAIYRAGGPEAYLKAQPLFLFPAEWISDHLADLDEQAAHHVKDFQDEATLVARIGALRDFDVSDQLERITCPVLVIGTEDDMLVPVRSSYALASGLPDATLVLMPRGGHAVNVTERAAFDTQLLEFLEKVGR